jgi:glycosyltransferase involved in cell wall biosynthesis
MRKSSFNKTKNLQIAYILEEPTSWILSEVEALERTGLKILVCLCNWQRDPEIVGKFWIEKASCYKYMTAVIFYLRLFKLEFIKLAIRTKTQIGLRLSLRMIYFAYVIFLNKINHVHAHFAATATTVAKGISQLTGVPYSFSVHAYDLFKISVDTKDLEEKILNAVFVRMVSQYHLNFLSGLNGKIQPPKIKVISYGVDPGLFKPMKLARARNSTLLSVSNLVPKKGFLILLDACVELLALKVDWKLIIGGDGPLRPVLEKRIEELDLTEKIDLIGHVDHKDLNNLFNLYDVFVLPCVVTEDGDRDGIPNVLIEAMAAGMPVISTPVAGIPELITNGRTGILVPSKDAKSLAQAMYTLLVNKERAEAMAQNGRRHVIENFNIHHTAERLNFLFRQTSMPFLNLKTELVSQKLQPLEHENLLRLL